MQLIFISWFQPEVHSGELVTIADKAKGYTGVVSHLSGESSITERLMELGVITGSSISLCSRSALSGSSVIIVNGTTIALREVELKCIHV